MPRGQYPRKPGLKRKRKKLPISERFEPKVDRSGECWIWTGFRDKAGYGRITLGGRDQPVGYAHRVAYELYVGPIPDGAELDHLCRVRHCCNPSHLEPVTHKENVRRGVHPKQPNRGTGKCSNGHEIAVEGCFVKGRYIYCKACRRERAARERVAKGCN